MQYDIIIIGGGAAGFAVASFCVNSINKPKILIIEKCRKPMQKLAITGKGRCNLTNNCDMETLLRNIPKNASFMRSAFAKFTPLDTIEFFEGLGVPLKTERGNRVFPVSDNARDIVDALYRKCKPHTTIVQSRVTDVIRDDGIAVGVSTDNGSEYHADKIVIAAGGASYPTTGSTGDGYELARKLGHTIMPIKPALVPLEVAEPCCSAMSGLSLRNTVLSLSHNGKTVYKEQGELLFTHFGVSGPLVLTASMYINEPVTDYTLSLDLKPALDEKTLDKRLLRDFGKNKNRQFKNSLSDLLPEKLIAEIISRSGINPDKRVNEIAKSERKTLLSLLKDFRLTVTGFRPLAEAVITDGGICVKEISPKTMESKLVKNLYFAGEVIDVSGFTGGFNLQIAFSTAYAVASG